MKNGFGLTKIWWKHNSQIWKVISYLPAPRSTLSDYNMYCTTGNSHMPQLTRSTLTNSACRPRETQWDYLLSVEQNKPINLFQNWPYKRNMFFDHTKLRTLLMVLLIFLKAKFGQLAQEHYGRNWHGETEASSPVGGHNSVVEYMHSLKKKRRGGEKR